MVLYKQAWADGASADWISSLSLIKLYLYLTQIKFYQHLNHYNLGLFWKMVYNLIINNILIFSGIQ